MNILKHLLKILIPIFTGMCDWIGYKYFRQHISCLLGCFVISESKSFSLCFKRKDLKISSPTFFLDQSKIPLVEQCRYLGTTISIKNCDLDLKRQMRKMYANANLLLRKFSRLSQC